MRRLALAIALLLHVGVARATNPGTVFTSAVDGDAAAMYWNPAALSRTEGSRVDVVGNLNIVSASYQRAGLDSQTNAPYGKVSLVEPAPQPVVGIVIDKLYKKRLRLGLTFSVPDESGSGWPRSVTQNGQSILGPTRYHATSGIGFNAYVQIGGSFKITNWLAVGAALNLVTSYLSFSKDVDLLNQPPLTATVPCAQNPFGCENPNFSAPFHLHGTGFQAGATVGVLLTPLERLRVGIGYMTPMYVPMHATAQIDTTKLEAYAQEYFPQFTPLNVNGSGHFTLVIPMRVNSAISVDLTKRLELMASLQWINTSKQPVVTGQLTQKGSTLLPDSVSIAEVRKDQYTVQLRGAWQVTPKLRTALLLEYTPHTYPNEFTSPASVDFDTFTINLGARYRFTKHFQLGATFSQFVVFSRTITASAFGNDRPAPYNLPDPSGKFTGNGERVGVDAVFFF